VLNLDFRTMCSRRCKMILRPAAMRRSHHRAPRVPREALVELTILLPHRRMLRLFATS
jgi:hypothetical protein